MTDVPAQAALKNNAELEAIADQLLADMNRLNMQAQGDEADIERLKAETSLLKAEARRLEAENQVVFARIKAALNAMAEDGKIVGVEIQDASDYVQALRSQELSPARAAVA